MLPHRFSHKSHLLRGHTIGVAEVLAIRLANLQIVETVLDIGNGKAKVGLSRVESRTASVAIDTNVREPLSGHEADWRARQKPPVCPPRIKNDSHLLPAFLPNEENAHRLLHVETRATKPDFEHLAAKGHIP